MHNTGNIVDHLNHVSEVSLTGSVTWTVTEENVHDAANLNHP